MDFLTPFPFNPDPCPVTITMEVVTQGSDRLCFLPAKSLVVNNLLMEKVSLFIGFRIRFWFSFLESGSRIRHRLRKS